jgi:outer membrane protein
MDTHQLMRHSRAKAWARGDTVLKHRTLQRCAGAGPSFRMANSDIRAPHLSILLWLTLSSAPGPGLMAQQSITLPEAVTLAQSRGHAARAATAARDAARYRDRAFASRLLPQLSLQGLMPDYNRSIISVLQPDGSTLFRPQHQTNANLAMTLSQKLPITGGDLLISSSLARLTVSGQEAIETWSSTPVAVGLRQDVFRPNVAAWDRREQSVRAELDERLYREAMEEVALQVSDAFFDAYAARVALDNAVTNASVNDTLYRLNQGRFEVGKIGANDLLQSELALLRARTAAQGAALAYERATAALRLALGLEPGTPLEVVADAAVPEVDVDTARAVAEALRNSAAVRDADLRDVQARRRVTEARLANGIGATVQASVGFNATAPEADLVYRNLLEARRFALSVEVPLMQWGAHGEGVRAAQADRERSANVTQAALEQVAHEAHFAALELAQARRDVALRAKADTVAGKRFEVAYNRYVIGRITIDNLYIAQTEKDQALTQFVQALRGYWQAYYRLRRVTLFDFATGQAIR